LVKEKTKVKSVRWRQNSGEHFGQGENRVRLKGLGGAGKTAPIFVKEKTIKVKRVRWRWNSGTHFCQGENKKGKKG